ncbi:PQQ-binding-like beta-propeller repeat protein [Halobacteriaceae archaeon GCM10025711]
MDTPWPMWRFDHANTGHSPDAGPGSDVHRRWEYDAEYTVPGTPVVAGRTVHVATMAPGLSRSNLHGLDVDTGARRYVTPEDDPGVELRGSPTFADSIVYVTLLDDPDRVRGYDATSGECVRAYEAQTPGMDGIPPVLYEGSLYVTTDATLTAFDPITEQERWRDVPHESFYGSAAFVENTVFVGTVAVNYESVPTDDGSEVVSVLYPRLRALDAATGETRWETELDFVPRTVAVDDGTVFSCGPESYHRFFPDDGRKDYSTVQATAVDGEHRWSAGVDAEIRSAPAIADETVIVGTEAGDGEDAEALLAFDAATGQRLWQYTGTGSRTAPSVGDGVVYSGSDAGFVDAVSLADGALLWRFETVGGVYGPPSVSGGRVYVGDGNGTVFALESRS